MREPHKSHATVNTDSHHKLFKVSLFQDFRLDKNGNECEYLR